MRVSGLLAIALPLAALLTAAPSPAAQPPNVVVVMSDDQTPDSIARMPWLSTRDGWLQFERFYDNQSLCCPSRATFLTGQYSHHHGVTSNHNARHFDDSASLGRWLHRVGYKTGLFGKYLNGFPWDRKRSYVPPGWDRWVSFVGVNGRYYDYDLSVDGRIRHYDHRPRDYSTDVFTHHALHFVHGAPQPFFMLVTPFGPHGPATPAPRDAGAFASEPVDLPPNFNVVADDQPAYYRALPPVSKPEQVAKIRRTWAAGLAVDDSIHAIKRALSLRGVLDDTLVIYLSDNGLSKGSHRYPSKNCLYESCVRVPMLIRYPGGPGGPVATPVSNVDLAPTIATLAGADPTVPVDGESLTPYLDDAMPWPDSRDLLLEVHDSQEGVPNGYAVVDGRWKYASHQTGEVELYDLDADPYELDNLADDADYDEIEADLADRLEALIGP